MWPQQQPLYSMRLIVKELSSKNKRKKDTIQIRYGNLNSTFLNLAGISIYY